MCWKAPGGFGELLKIALPTIIALISASAQGFMSEKL